MAYKKLWKTLKNGLCSDYDGSKWVVGEWRKIEGAISCCDNGFHGSELLTDAFYYVKPGCVARVEVCGECDDNGDKQAWSEMRVLEYYNWTEQDDVRIQIFAAELVLHIFEREYPEDNRPRLAVEAKKNWLKDPTASNKEKMSAAWAAARDVAWAAARAAAGDAAGAAAGAAAWAAAGDAAWDAAGAAAGDAARDAARAAAGAATFAKINKEIIKIIEEKEPCRE